jgi:hypothetical protein
MKQTNKEYELDFSNCFVKVGPEENRLIKDFTGVILNDTEGGF